MMSYEAYQMPGWTDVAECVHCVHPVAEDWVVEGKEGQRVNKAPFLFRGIILLDKFALGSHPFI